MIHQTTRTFCRAACAVSVSLFLVSITACGGSALTVDNPHQTAVVENQTSHTGSNDLRQETPERRAMLDAEWQALIDNPGVPGEDYDPQRLTVFYKPGLRSVSAAGTNYDQAQALAAGKPNAILRENTQYEIITGSIALQYGLGIETQAYINDCNFAGFTLPEGVDGDTVLESIRSQFADSVEWATYARLMTKCYTVNDPDFNSSTSTSGGLWGHKKIRCGEAWDYTRGSTSVRIAVVDTGIRLTHEELSYRVLNPQSEFPGETCDLANGDNSIEDSDGHGTFIAGLVCARGNNNRTIVGVAHDCEVIPVKISNGESTPDNRLAAGCLLAGELGAKVVNLSWGDEHTASVLESMVNSLVSDNILFVAAAGNDNVPTHHYPSDYTNAVSVGWTDQNDQQTGSNYGDLIDICAPGEYLRSSAPDSDSDYKDNGAGTSYAAPIVAAAAGLLYTMEPALSIEEVRSLLENTGDPVTGFSTTNPPLRLDIAAAMEELGRIKVFTPKPDKLIYQGSITIQPEVRGTPDQVEYYLNNTLITTAANAPWAADLDLSSIVFGYASVRVRAVQGSDSSDSYITILVDNSSGSYPVIEHFDQLQNRNFIAMDARILSESVVSSVKQANPYGWNYDSVVANGQGSWVESTSGAFSAPNSMHCGLAGNTYDSYETDLLVSRLINLTSAEDPTLVFQQHYNLQQSFRYNDRAYVLVSEDFGETWSRASQQGGDDAIWNGYQASWDEARIDLSDYEGKQIHIAFLMESNWDETYGEDETRPAGWWVDDIAVAMDYLSSVPTLGNVSVTPYTLMGEIPEVLEIPLTVSDPQDVAQVTYHLDFAPFGTIGAEDIILPVDAAPFSSTLVLDSDSDAPNQLAQLHVRYFNSESAPGPEITIPVWIFNHRGDVNADGVVDQSDFDAYPEMVGVTNQDSTYVPFFDTNLDGVITEADACSVGYNWES